MAFIGYERDTEGSPATANRLKLSHSGLLPGDGTELER